LQLLWDFRNEQRPAAEPQQLEDPIHNDSKAPFDDITAPPSEDLLNIEPDETFEAGPSAAQRSEQDPEASTGRGLIIRPPGVDLAKLRPRVMLHIHLSEEALLSYHNGKLGIAGGVCRLEGVGPITLGQVRRFLRDTGCDVTVQPVIDPQERPSSRQLRNSATDPGGHVPPDASQLLSVRNCNPTHGPRPHDPLPPTHARRTAGANRRRHARPTDPLRTSRQNTWPMASTPTRTRSLDLATTPQRPLPGQQCWHLQLGRWTLRAPSLARRGTARRRAITN